MFSKEWFTTHFAPNSINTSQKNSNKAFVPADKKLLCKDQFKCYCMEM